MPDNKRILTVDIGNTAMKVSVYEGETLLTSMAGKEVTPAAVMSYLGDSDIRGVACCRVGEDTQDITGLVRRMTDVPFLELGPDTPVPVDVDYTRATLGNDRLAAVVGVASVKECVLLADVGTALTLDLARGLRYAGGNISPGLRLRFESLNRFTALLPLVDADGPTHDFGHNTKDAIRSGVVRGLAYEIAGTLDRVRIYEPDARLVVTGGSAGIISKQLTVLGVRHEVDRQAVGRGLVRIFNYVNEDYNDSNE